MALNILTQHGSQAPLHSSRVFKILEIILLSQQRVENTCRTGNNALIFVSAQNLKDGKKTNKRLLWCYNWAWAVVHKIHIIRNAGTGVQKKQRRSFLLSTRTRRADDIF